MISGDGDFDMELGHENKISWMELMPLWKESRELVALSARWDYKKLVISKLKKKEGPR